MKRFFASYIYILLPFAALILIRLSLSDFESVLYATDWSVASFIIYAQSIGVITNATAKNKNRSVHGINIFFGITLLLMMPSIAAFAVLTIGKSVIWGAIQIVLFIVASLWYCAVFKAEDKLSSKK